MINCERNRRITNSSHETKAKPVAADIYHWTLYQGKSFAIAFSMPLIALTAFMLVSLIPPVYGAEKTDNGQNSIAGPSEGSLEAKSSVMPTGAGDPGDNQQSRLVSPKSSRASKRIGKHKNKRTNIENNATMTKLAAEVLALAQKEFPSLELQGDGAQERLKLGKRGHISLANLYRMLSDEKDPHEREKQIRRFLSSVEELAATKHPRDSDWNEVKNRLRPQIFPAAYLKSLKIVRKPLDFSDKLMEGYVIDDANTFRYVTEQHLVRWNKSIETVKKIAYSNLENKSQEISLSKDSELNSDAAKDIKAKTGKFAAVSVTDGYSAARLLLPEIKRKLHNELGDPCFVAIPNRDFLVAWSTDFHKIKEFEKQVRLDFRIRHHPLAPTIFELKGNNLRAVSNFESGIQSIPK